MASTSTATSVERAPVDAATHAFVVPQAQLRGEHSLDAWIRSDAASTVLDAVVTLSAAVRGVKIRDVKQTSDVRMPVPCPWVMDRPLTPVALLPLSPVPARPPSAFARPALAQFVQRVVALLDTLAGWVDAIPPLQDHKQRYGNKAFRTWYARLVQVRPSPPLSQRARPEAPPKRRREWSHHRRHGDRGS